jgi:catechol 2,3-dioxygenase-like lactoylglutathione lyase family enzyme
MFKRMEHVAISVKDMEKAIAFYRDIIGMAKVLDRVFDANLARVTGLPEAKARVVHMQLADSMVELFEYLHPKGRGLRQKALQSDYGIIHLSFKVEDFWATCKHLTDHGVRFLGEAVEFRPGSFVAYFLGAEGEVIEMREVKTR